MFKKLCILLIYSILEMVKPLIYHQYMHNLYTIFSKILKICKQFGDNLINEKGNIPRPGVVPKFSDIEVIALNLTSEAMGIDSESNLFIRLSEYKDKMPNLISRRQYNDRRKTTSTLCDTIRKRIAEKIDGGEEYFCIDSKPIEVCRVARGKRCKMGRNDYSKAPSFGYCASQKNYYYGYKLHAICGLSGVIHSFDLTKASVHDINYLKNIKYEYPRICRSFISLPDHNRHNAERSANFLNLESSILNRLSISAGHADRCEFRTTINDKRFMAVCSTNTSFYPLH